VDAASDTGSMLVSQAGNLHISGPLSLGTYGSMYIGSAGTITLDNLNGTVDQDNGGLFNGTLVVTNGLRLNFNNNTLPFTGSGQIAVQGPGVIISNGSGTPGGTVGVNIVLNSSNLPFAKTDVTQTTLNTSGSAGFISTIGGTKIGTTTGPGSVLAINGVISGNSDVNFSNSPGGGGSGNIQLNAQNTYTGASLIDFTGNANGGAPGGNVYLGVNNALPTTTDVVFGAIGGLASATLDLNGNNQTISSLSDGASGNASGYNITNSGNANSTLTISGTATPARPYGGFLSDGLFGYTLAIVKSGTNTLTLTNSASGYSGGTTVLGGQLLINTSTNGGGSPTGAGDVTVTGGTFGGIGNVGNLDNRSDQQGGIINVSVGPGATLAPGVLPYGNVARTPGTLNIAGNLTLSASSNVNFNDFSGSGDQVDVESTLTLPGTGSVIVNLSNVYGGTTGGTVQLFNFTGEGLSGGTLSSGQLVIGNAPSGASYAISENPNGSEIDLTITPGSTAALTVSGGTTDWGTAIFTTPNTTVTLSSTSSAPSTITVSGNQLAGAIELYVTNSNGITLSQGFGGSLTLDTSAGASISAAGGGSSAISVPLVLAGNLAVSLTGGSILELGNVSQGATAAALDLSGNGMLILTCSDSYTGGTVVNGGTLVVANNNALESGTSLEVGAGASGLFTPSIAGAVIPATEGVAAVPEPGTLALLAVGGLLAAVGALRRRKR